MSIATALPTGRSARLAGLMFFHVLVAGAYMPAFPLLLARDHDLSGAAIGWVLCLPVVAAWLAPVAIGVLPRRLQSDRAAFSLLQAASTLALAALAVTTFTAPFLVAFSALALLQAPTAGLANVLVFRHLRQARERYGQYRLFGTLGWLAAGWCYLAWAWASGTSRLAHAFGIAALATAACVALTLTLPKEASASDALPRRAFDPTALTVAPMLLLVVFGSGIVNRFVNVGVSLHLAQLGVPDRWVLPALTLGQVTEVAALLALSPLVRYFGLLRTLQFGLLAQLTRVVLLATARSTTVALVAVSLNGVIFALVFAAVLVGLDQASDDRRRTAVHQVVFAVQHGAAALVGNLLAGNVLGALRHGDRHDFQTYWLAASAVAGVVVLFAVVYGGRLTRETLGRPAAASAASG